MVLTLMCDLSANADSNAAISAIVSVRKETEGVVCIS